MASVSYYVRQDNRRTGTGLWYGKAYIRGTLTFDQIAQQIQNNCSMKKSDVIAYLTELIEVMQQKLTQGYKVQLGDIGYFSVGLTSLGALSEKKWNAKEYLKSMHVVFKTVNVKVGDVGYTRAIWDGEKTSFVKMDENPYTDVKPKLLRVANKNQDGTLKWLDKMTVIDSENAVLFLEFDKEMTADDVKVYASDRIQVGGAIQKHNITASYISGHWEVNFATYNLPAGKTEAKANFSFGSKVCQATVTGD
mgnify:CR=1 FL=1